MRRKRVTQWLAILAVAAFMLAMVSPAWAESGCHKTKGKGGSSGGVKIVHTVS